MEKILFRLLLISLFFTAKTNIVHAQDAEDLYEHLYLVKFNNKNLNYVNRSKPESYLTQKALDRRAKYNIPIDSFDYPVSTSYIESIRTKGLRILYPTRWLNGIVVSTDEHDLARSCLLLFYVDKVYYLGKKRKSGVASKLKGTRDVGTSDSWPEVSSDKMQDELKEKYASSYNQLSMLNGVELHASGYTGKGISIAVFDAGFFGANENPIFDNLGDRVVKTWDFVDMEENVYNDDPHGAHVLSCMAASKKNEMIGSAPDATYYLFRTESAKYEYLYEEIHWIRAAEVADSLGVDVINSSLGYTYFDDQMMNHSWNDLGGHTWISKGAGLAVSRGILVVNAAGNEGTGKWKYINPPADIPEVLTVGAVKMNGDHVNFSSYGYHSLSVVKPDICAPGFGVSTATSSGKITQGNGTSYASPIVCGLAACMLQAHPEARPYDIILAIVNSADRRLQPDSAFGHGIPDFLLANAMLSTNEEAGFVKVADHSNVTGNNKVLMHVKGGESYNVTFYTPSKFLIFPKGKNKVKRSGLVLSEGYAVIPVPDEFATEKTFGVKARVATEKGKVRFRQIINR